MALIRRTRRDLWLAAVFLWMTPWAAALSIRFTARRSSLGAVLGPGLGGRHGALGAGAHLGARPTCCAAGASRSGGSA